MREYKIDFSKLETYEAGAILVTLLARPEADTPEEVRGAHHASLCALFLQATAANDPAWEATSQSMRPLYALRESGQIERDLRQEKSGVSWRPQRRGWRLRRDVAQQQGRAITGGPERATRRGRAIPSGIVPSAANGWLNQHLS